jgi:uncharacterized protein YegL
MTFSSVAQWVYDLYLEKDVTSDWANLEASGLTNLGLALDELRRHLSFENGILSDLDNAYPPLVIFISDGSPTDNWEKPLRMLQENQNYQKSFKRVIAIGDDADKDVLTQFTGTNEAVFTVHNIEALKQIIRVVAVTSSQIGSKSSTAGDITKQEQVIKDVTEAAKDINGAQSEAAPAPANPSDNYDDWD